MSNKNDFVRSTDLDHARDELFGHIHRCGVLRSTPEQQAEWMDETVEYLGERYPSLARSDMDELKEIGMRFCQPVIRHGKENTALSDDRQSAPEDEVQEANAA